MLTPFGIRSSEELREESSHNRDIWGPASTTVTSQNDPVKGPAASQSKDQHRVDIWVPACTTVTSQNDPVKGLTHMVKGPASRSKDQQHMVKGRIMVQGLTPNLCGERKQTSSASRGQQQLSLMSEAAAFVEAKRLQLEQLLETHAAALSLDNANVHLSYNDPITPDELPAFTWLSILYACTKERCLDPARGLEGQFPSAVWDWVEALATELEPSDSDARARAVFAELRTVCVSWIGRVGLRRALSIWDLFCWEGDEAFFKQTGLRNMSELDTRRWLFDTVQIYGPNPDSFPYPEEVRLEIVHSKQLPNVSKTERMHRKQGN
ncbi:hypothetical protein HDU89_008608 [Geranomyces variabilis]|nr:hypothetical protein HDU89_008608 [Geranomyces variabilis]